MEKIGSMNRTPSEDDEKPGDIQLSYRRSRRRRVTPYRYQVDAYYPDDHPEIPRIRRASLQLNAQHEEKTSQKRSKKPAPSNRARNNRKQSSLKDRLQSLSPRQAPLIVGILAIMILILAPIMFTSAILNNHPSSTSGTSNQRAPAKGTSIPVNQRPADPHQIVIIPSDTDHPPPPVFAQSAYLLDADTGVTLYAYNPFKHIPMLSTTKLMTAVIALEIGNPAQKHHHH
jgi:hypothetical protein